MFFNQSKSFDVPICYTVSGTPIFFEHRIIRTPFKFKIYIKIFFKV